MNTTTDILGNCKYLPGEQIILSKAIASMEILTSPNDSELTSIQPLSLTAIISKQQNIVNFVETYNCKDDSIHPELCMLADMDSDAYLKLVNRLIVELQKYLTEKYS